MNKASDTAQLKRLERLAAMSDETIDTCDLPVIEDWSDGVRGGRPADVRQKLGVQRQTVASLSAATPDRTSGTAAPRRRARTRVTAELPGQPTLQQATIIINKLEAARRQLDTAIRMTFANEDELAIHTVAAAAYRILRDLLEKRGRFDLDELVTAGLYETARRLAARELPQGEMERHPPALQRMLESIAEDMKVEGRGITPEDIGVSLDLDRRREDWKRLSVTANFLKHADRDAGTHLSLDTVDNDEILMRAIGAYLLVVGQKRDGHPLRQTPEMSAFHIWWLSRHDPAQLRREYGDDFADAMQHLSPSRRRRGCLRLIRQFARGRAEAA